MKWRIIMALVLSALTLVGPRLAAQSCDDDDGMAQGAIATLANLVATVKKETLADFQTRYHQKNAGSKLAFAIASLDEAIECRSKAAQDSTATPDQAAANHSKQEADTKLRQRFDQYRKQLKATDDPKAAKALIESFNFST
jgi:hypothetical protein